RYRNDPAVSGRTRLTRREQPPLSLVQNWLKRLEASPDGSDVNHRVRVSAPAPEARQFLDSFVAFLPVSRFFSSDSIVRAQALSAVFRPGSVRERANRGASGAAVGARGTPLWPERDGPRHMAAACSGGVHRVGIALRRRHAG